MSRKGPFILFRVLGLLLVLGLIVGSSVMAYNAGFTQGVSQAPAVAKAIEKAAESGQGAPMMYGNGYGYYPHSYGYGHHFGFFPFGSICGSIIFLFFFFGFIKMIFFRRMWGGHHMRGSWGRHGDGDVPSKFDEWHKHAHEEKPAQETDKKE